jgi:hypothetical protein
MNRCNCCNAPIHLDEKTCFLCNRTLSELAQWIDEHQFKGKIGTYMLKERISEILNGK